MDVKWILALFLIPFCLILTSTSFFYPTSGKKEQWSDSVAQPTLSGDMTSISWVLQWKYGVLTFENEPRHLSQRPPRIKVLWKRKSNADDFQCMTKRKGGLPVGLWLTHWTVTLKKARSNSRRAISFTLRLTPERND